MTRARSHPAGWPWFAAWLLVGAGLALALLGAMTIGIFVLPVVTVVAVLLATRRPSHVGWPGLISGLSLPLFYVAYLNRDGPGEVCRAFASGGGECKEEWSPLPWIAVGLVLLVAGVVVFIATTRSRDPFEPLA